MEELARKFHVSSTIIYDCLEHLDVGALLQSKILLLESLSSIAIGIDEFSFIGRNYMLQITELRTKKVIGILTSTSVAAIEQWCHLLPLSVLQKIDGIASDMNASYKKTIQDHIRKRLKEAGLKHMHIADIQTHELGVVDHFHMKQIMTKTLVEVHSLNNWMIKSGHYDGEIRDLAKKETRDFNKYRTDVLMKAEAETEAKAKAGGKAETESKTPAKPLSKKHLLYTPNDPTYQPITLGHFLSHKYGTLLLLNGDKLTNKQQHRLNQILHEFDPCGYLKEAYIAKELFFEAIDTKDAKTLAKVIEDMKTSLQYKIETCGKTLEKWKQCILNFFTVKITNAFTEGKNTKIKLMKRMAY